MAPLSECSGRISRRLPERAGGTAPTPRARWYRMRRKLARKRFWKATMATARDRSKLPLLVIVGPTACGKTSLAVRIAKEYDGEVISADSRAIYKDLDIGTAKPTPEEQNVAPHWGVDLVMPGDRFTAADFKEYALEKIRQIRARRHLPILAGGTGLYRRRGRDW